MNLLVATLVISSVGIGLLSLLSQALIDVRSSSRVQTVLDWLALWLQAALGVVLPVAMFFDPSSLAASLGTLGHPIMHSHPLCTFLGLFLFAIFLMTAMLRAMFLVRKNCAIFFLDVMPGAQISIDVDLSAGLITIEQARSRRLELQAKCQLHDEIDSAARRHRFLLMAETLFFSVSLLGIIMQAFSGRLSSKGIVLVQVLPAAMAGFLLWLSVSIPMTLSPLVRLFRFARSSAIHSSPFPDESRRCL